MENLEQALKSTLEHLKAMTDTDTVIGKPVVNGDGTVILPVSKVSIGFVVGGGEYSESNPKSRSEGYPHAAASGGGVTVTPVGFLVCGREKRFVSVDKTTDSKWSELLKCAISAVVPDEDGKK